jgi:hypothetical protein
MPPTRAVNSDPPASGDDALAASLTIDVWLDAALDDSLLARLAEALGPSGGSVLGVETTAGSLWPLPVVDRVPSTRARLVVRPEGAGRGVAVAETLQALSAVAEWSIVQRHPNASPATPPPSSHLH